MEHETLKQWISNARLTGTEDADGLWLVSSSDLEITVGYMEDAELVVCFAPLLELAGLEDGQRLAILSQSLSLNGVGNLPLGCALSYEEERDVVYLLWQQSPDVLDSTRFANAFEDFKTAAIQVQELLREMFSEESDTSDDSEAQDFVIKV